MRARATGWGALPTSSICRDIFWASCPIPAEPTRWRGGAGVWGGREKKNGCQAVPEERKAEGARGIFLNSLSRPNIHPNNTQRQEFYFQMSLLWGACCFPGDVWWRCPFLPASLAATRRLWLPLLPGDERETPRGVFRGRGAKPAGAEAGARWPRVHGSVGALRQLYTGSLAGLNTCVDLPLVTR